MPLKNDEIQNNIDKFLEEHGLEGFLRLYLREYLFELLMDEIKDATDENSTDSAIQLYFDSDFESEQAVREFEEELRARCDERAQEMVEAFQQDDELQELFEKQDPAILERDEIEDEVTDQMHEMIEIWSESDEG